ncbi:hypothetical protein EHP00_2134 [Ecytonucleospora hepatopenaei]|uniref:Uncharacterized protein n=1 Tax=Ecytonucleospora hepatopenaei TaxID=646526 RepID=A0A1W0E966_9MICR|nr:hypothetical protein EHP00_2134 [Ecytonucleospora hepatopenaei]
MLLFFLCLHKVCLNIHKVTFLSMNHMHRNLARLKFLLGLSDTQCFS